MYEGTLGMFNIEWMRLTMVGLIKLVGADLEDLGGTRFSSLRVWLFLDGKYGNLGSFYTNQKSSASSLASTSAYYLNIIGQTVMQDNRFTMRSDNLTHYLTLGKLFDPA